MGASEFFTRARGKTAEEAFSSAVARAKHDHGHAGYSGTIAEKHSFTLVAVPPEVDASGYAEKLLADDDRRVSDKWGPAGCVRIEDGEWLFFGWASS